MMKFGEAVIIFKNINSEKYTLEEKINAIDVVMCNGTGEVQTNEEWFATLPTKEKAEVIVETFLDDGEWNEYIDRYSAVENWLKEKHNA